MHLKKRTKWLQWPSALALTLCIAGMAVTARFLTAEAPPTPQAVEQSFDHVAKPFFKQNCVQCHNAELNTGGIKIDQLDGGIEDRQLPVWDAIRRRLREGTMPPKGMPQPSAADRQHMVDWISQAMEMSRLRPAEKNGMVRRLTISQYRNTLSELLKLDDNLTEGLPPDAVSKDGFLNNKDSLQLSPTLTESYFEVAQDALNRAIVDPSVKPVIQDFRVDLGASVNPAPIKDKLILGADSALLNNEDVLVTQPKVVKPFPFTAFAMKTHFRFIEGYQGNDTVRGWREFETIYHNVYADMRSSPGYPKGEAYSTVPGGLLLRPAIPNDANFGVDSTNGPKANFKVSVRQLPEFGRFKVTVMAARYNDGLLLDAGAAPLNTPESVTWRPGKDPDDIKIQKAGLYQVDLYQKDATPPPPDTSHLTQGLTASWLLNGAAGASDAKLQGDAKLVDSPFGKSVSLTGASDSVVLPRAETMNVGEGDFTVAAWIRPTALRKSAILALGGDQMHGWYLEMADRGAIRLETNGPDNESNGIVTSPPGAFRADAWQHIAVAVKRAQAGETRKNESRLYINGFPVARGSIGPANLDNPKFDLRLGRLGAAQPFAGELEDVRIYRRTLSEAEVQGLLLPGKQFVQPPPAGGRGGGGGRQRQDVATVTLGDRQFSGAVQSAFVVVRLPAGPLALAARNTGVRDIDHLVITPMAETSDIGKRFAAFEKRQPRVGVHLGLRRDCGSTFAPVGPPQTVTSDKPAPYVFEGALRNFPSPQDEKDDNPNYLQGVHEIGVRSEYTDARDMPRMVVHSVEFQGPYYDQWPPASHKNIFVDFDRKNDQPAYARKIVKDFATRAWRRPVTGAEEAMLVSVWQKSMEGGSNFTDAIKDSLMVVLTSPQFLFLIETSKSPAPEPLDNYELASKLSYFLWNGPPDHKALQLAASGQLPKQLEAEVTRMIEDPQFTRFANEFTSQWLNLDKFQVVEIDRRKYPNLTLGAREQLKQEPVEFLEYLVRQNLGVRNLIQSDFIMANETV
ncbi:MAG: DUF1592 domain-containing protein, partial [Terriglobia bacterium]